MSAFGAKRTSRERREHADPTKMTQSGHKPGRNPALQRSPVHVLSFGGPAPPRPSTRATGRVPQQFEFFFAPDEGGQAGRVQRRWFKATDGEGQVVLLSGEA